MNALPWVISGLPLAFGFALLVLALRGKSERASGPVGILVAGSVFVLSTVAAAFRPTVAIEWLDGVSLVLAVDGIAAAMLLALSVIALGLLCVAHREIPFGEGRARCIGWLLVLFGASLAASMSTSLLGLLIAWEVMAIALWQLMGFSWQDRREARAGLQVFLFLRAGDLGLYLALVAALVGAGTADIGTAAAAMGEPWIHLAAAGLIHSAAVKSAQLPFSSWLSAPFARRGHISGALAAALMVVAGGYLLVRTYDVLAAAGWALPAVAWLGGATALVLGLVALGQRDLQQALAASSASQKGFILLAVGVGTVPGAVAYLIAHGAFKALLFAGSALYLSRAGTTDLGRIGRAQAAMPRLVLLFSVGALALAGIPPLSGWAVKDEVMSAALASSPALFGIGLIAAVVTALYAARMLWLVRAGDGRPPAHGVGDGPPAQSVAGDAAGWSAVGLSILAVTTLAMSALLFGPVREGWLELLGGPVGPPAPLWELVLMALLALGALLLVHRWQRDGRLEPPALPVLAGAAPFRRWLALPRITAAIGRSLMAAGRMLARFDDGVLGEPIAWLGRGGTAAGRWGAAQDDQRIDAPIDALAARVAGAGRWAAAQDERQVDGLVDALAARVGAAGRWARRPQTGLLHQYYAQAVVVVVVLALTFWVVR